MLHVHSIVDKAMYMIAEYLAMTPRIFVIPTTSRLVHHCDRSTMCPAFHALLSSNPNGAFTLSV